MIVLWVVLWLAGSSAIFAAHAPKAQQAPPQAQQSQQSQPPTADAALLERLGSKQYAVRQQATDRLLRDNSVKLDHLDKLFKEAETPEQRQRLLTVIRHHFDRRMRENKFGPGKSAAVGFSHQVYRAGMAPGYDGAAVLVVQTLPGFPACAYLHPGDLIVAVDGKPLPDATTSNTFKNLLRRWQAGETLPLTVRRDGERIKRDVPLAGLKALLRMYPNAPRLSDAYRKRWLTYRRRLMNDVPPIPRLQPAGESR